MIDRSGDSEADDPYHYALSMALRIAAVPGQEIATHTFSHYYCLEDGPSVQDFERDLEAAKKSRIPPRDRSHRDRVSAQPVQPGPPGRMSPSRNQSLSRKPQSRSLSAPQRGRHDPNDTAHTTARRLRRGGPDVTSS